MKIKDKTNIKYGEGDLPISIDYCENEKKESWKKWNSWVLDEEEIMMIAESLGLDYENEVKELVEQVAQRFKDKLSNSESNYWAGYIGDSIKEILELGGDDPAHCKECKKLDLAYEQEDHDDTRKIMMEDFD